MLDKIKKQRLGSRIGCFSSLYGYLSRLLAVLFCACTCNWTGILTGWEILKYGLETDGVIFLECFKLKAFESSHSGGSII